MSILTTAKPRRESPQLIRVRRRRLASGPLAGVFVSEFAALTSFYLMLSVTPIYAAAGAGSAGAGLVTAVLLLGTVAAELAAPLLMNRLGHRTLLAAGSLLLGVPAVALLPGGPLGIIVAVSFVRGFGFGLTTVLTGALTAMLLPPERRGEGLGLFGVVATAPGIIALPAGVWLAGHSSVTVVVALTVAAALVPLATLRRLPGDISGRQVAADGAAGQAESGNAGHQAETGGARPAGLLAGLRQRGQLRPFLIFAATTMPAGVIVSFLPLAAGASGNIATAGLLVQALTATLSRWWAGRAGDRHSHASLLVPALVIACAGMIALLWLASPAAVIIGMCLFGAGFGIAQNATFVLMIDRMPPAGAGTASALWNLAYDGGYGAGPALFGLFVTHTGYPVAFALMGMLMAAALPAARREHAA